MELKIYSFEMLGRWFRVKHELINKFVDLLRTSESRNLHYLLKFSKKRKSIKRRKEKMKVKLVKQEKVNNRRNVKRK